MTSNELLGIGFLISAIGFFYMFHIVDNLTTHIKEIYKELIKQSKELEQLKRKKDYEF